MLIIHLACRKLEEVTDLLSSLMTGCVSGIQSNRAIGRAGEARRPILIELTPRPYVRHESDDIHLKVPVALAEVVLSRRITVPTPAEKVSLSPAARRQRHAAFASR